MKRQNNSRQASKLKLRKQTVRTLSSQQLSGVAGGAYKLEAYQYDLNYEVNAQTADCWTIGTGTISTHTDPLG